MYRRRNRRHRFHSKETERERKKNLFATEKEKSKPRQKVQFLSETTKKVMIKMNNQRLKNVEPIYITLQRNPLTTGYVQHTLNQHQKYKAIKVAAAAAADTGRDAVDHAECPHWRKRKEEKSFTTATREYQLQQTVMMQ